MKEVTSTERYTTICVPLKKESLLGSGVESRNVDFTFSLFKKSLASSNSISLTPGFKTMLAIGRLCLESVQRHEP